MFETALVESSDLLRTRNRAPALLSIAAQAIFVAAILSCSLLRPGTLIPRHDDLSVAHRISMPTPTPPPHPIHLIPTLRPATTLALPNPTPQPILQHPSADPTPPTPSDAGFRFEGPGMATSVPAIFGNGTPSHPSIAVASGTDATGKRTGTPSAGARPNISTGVSAGLLLTPILPVYPAIARAARQSGTVVVEATISAAGRIESARATSGPATLQFAAVDAVRHARYRPFLLNGQPTEVTATFSIRFTLDE